MLKVTVDDVAYSGVIGWSTSGNILLLEFNDGSFRGLTGFVDFLVERVEK